MPNLRCKAPQTCEGSSPTVDWTDPYSGNPVKRMDAESLKDSSNGNMRKTQLPKFYDWGGPRAYSWSFGWATGPDHDLVCIAPNVISEVGAEVMLSPVCSNRILALTGFLLKVALVRIDRNSWQSS